MNIVSTLNEELLKQVFLDTQDGAVLLTEYQHIAQAYAMIENCIAVLSDLKSNKSYIYHGGMASRLGLSERGTTKEINSIWEESIFNRIHPDDLAGKFSLELQFFHLLKSLPVSERSDYHIISKMRMSDSSGKYMLVQHRVFYVCSSSSDDLWLALCLYGCCPSEEPMVASGMIVNTSTGEVIKPNHTSRNDILSAREKEILQLIVKGEMSKSIASILSISINTVNRHRQNILEKLQVKNSFEACRIAKVMGLI